MSQRSHGDGRRMTLTEAIERRIRFARFWGHGHMAHGKGSVIWSPQNGGGDHRHDRRWLYTTCQRCRRARADDHADVGLLDGIPVAMCATRRAAQRERPQPLDAVERLVGGAP